MLALSGFAYFAYYHCVAASGFGLPTEGARAPEPICAIYPAIYLILSLARILSSARLLWSHVHRLVGP